MINTGFYLTFLDHNPPPRIFTVPTERVYFLSEPRLQMNTHSALNTNKLIQRKRLLQIHPNKLIEFSESVSRLFKSLMLAHGTSTVPLQLQKYCKHECRVGYVWAVLVTICFRPDGCLSSRAPALVFFAKRPGFRLVQLLRAGRSGEWFSVAMICLLKFLVTQSCGWTPSPAAPCVIVSRGSGALAM